MLTRTSMVSRLRTSWPSNFPVRAVYQVKGIARITHYFGFPYSHPIKGNGTFYSCSVIAHHLSFLIYRCEKRSVKQRSWRRAIQPSLERLKYITVQDLPILVPRDGKVFRTAFQMSHHHSNCTVPRPWYRGFCTLWVQVIPQAS